MKPQEIVAARERLHKHVSAAIDGRTTDEILGTGVFYVVHGDVIC